MPTKERPRDRVYTNEEIRAIFAAVPGTELEDLVPLVFFTGVRSRPAAHHSSSHRIASCPALVTASRIRP
jgi:hypothetical protein